MNLKTNRTWHAHNSQYRRDDLPILNNFRAQICNYNNQVAFIVIAVVGAFIAFVMNLQLTHRALTILLVIAGAFCVVTAIGFVWLRSTKRKSGRLSSVIQKSRIKSDINKELGPAGISVDCSRGVVVLKGTITDPDYRRVAVEIARHHATRFVVDELMVVSVSVQFPRCGNSAPSPAAEVTNRDVRTPRLTNSIENKRCT